MRAQGSLLAIVIAYVDDLLYLAEKSPGSQLEWAQDPGGTRYLGMELHQREDYAFDLPRRLGYIRELLRNHSVDDTVGTRLPCPKEWLQDGESHVETEIIIPWRN